MNLTFTEGGQLAVGLWPAGATAYFEYHCKRCHSSRDAELWYHDRELVTVLGVDDAGDGYRAYLMGDSVTQRLDDGLAVGYRIRFADGYEGYALEDELLGGPQFFDPALGVAPASPPPADEIAVHRCLRAFMDWFERLNYKFDHLHQPG